MKGPIDWKVKLDEWDAFAPELIAVGSAAQKGIMLHKDGDFLFGIWEAEANTTNWLTYPCHEFMVLLEGSVAVIEERKVTTYSAGDCFVIAMGTRCIWSQSGRVRKFFVATTQGKLRGEDVGRNVQVRKIDPADQSISFAIGKTVPIWEAGLLSVGARKLKKGEKIAQGKHVLLHIVDASPKWEGQTVFSPSTGTDVAPDDMICIYCSYSAGSGAKL